MMAAECTREAVLAFLLEQGGKVKNADLITHFKAVFPQDAEQKAAVRDTFKTYVDSVAFVRSEDGVKHVCLRKKFHARNTTEPEPSEDATADRYPPPAAPGSGYGNDSQVRVPHNSTAGSSLENEAGGRSGCPRSVREVDGVGSSSGEMGNLESFRRDKGGSRKEQAGKAAEKADFGVREASPLPAEEPVSTPPGPARTGSAEPEAPSHRRRNEAEQLGATRCANFKGSQRRGPIGPPEEGGHTDAHRLPGSEDNSTPKGSRRPVTMSRSPQVRRSTVPGPSPWADCDSTSVASSTVDEDRAPVALDPVEHEWMMCASDGEWRSLHRLLAAEPNLVLRKDFVTGFTCLHWAAKHGEPELIALIMNFAKQHNIPISIDIRSSNGYTPLHIAAMHGRVEVVKLLVGAYDADVEIRDYSGRKACQYFSGSVSREMWDISGAHDYSVTDSSDPRDRSRWRMSDLTPLRQLMSSDCDPAESDGPPRETPLRRRSSLNRMKPKLQSLRARMSQIVHSASFRDREEQDEAKKSSFRSRPKSHHLG